MLQFDRLHKSLALTVVVQLYHHGHNATQLIHRRLLCEHVLCIHIHCMGRIQFIYMRNDLGVQHLPAYITRQELENAKIIYYFLGDFLLSS